MQSVLIELHYLPSLAYFNCLLAYDEVLIEAHEHFQKQSYRNRCHVLTASGIKALSIPVQKGNRKTLIKDLKIDYKQKWKNNHWRTITSAYGKSPFFEYYIEYFRYLFDKNYEFLFDWNWDLLTLCLKLLQLSPKLILTERYEKGGTESQSDFRSVIHPKKPEGMHCFYHPYPYQQTFGKDFVQNMSIVDLLFSEGPNAGAVLARSQKGH